MGNDWLTGKTVVITGGSGGLGRAMTEQLIRRWRCRVIAIGRDPDKLEATGRAVRQSGCGSFSYRAFDVTDRTAWAAFAADLADSGVAVDVLINNAGFMLPFSRLENLRDADIDGIISTNLRAYLTGFRALYPLMPKPGTGRQRRFAGAVINIVSAGGLCPVVGQGLYCATKYALRGLTDELRVEHPELYVCGVYPGFIHTDILARQRVDVAAPTREGLLIRRMMLPAGTAARRILRRISHRRTHIVIGADGHFLSVAGRVCPRTSAVLIRAVLKASELPLFRNVFCGK